MSVQENLFVYGTLRSGFTNQFARLLHRSGQLLGIGRVHGRLFSIAEYPGLVPSEENSEWVLGDVYRLTHPEATYGMLDRYEGCGSDDPEPHEFRRAVVPVLLETGEWIDASVYIYTRDVSGKQRIETGNFLTKQ